MTDVKAAKSSPMSTAHRTAPDNAASAKAQLPAVRQKWLGRMARSISWTEPAWRYSTFDYVI